MVSICPSKAFGATRPPMEFEIMHLSEATTTGFFFLAPWLVFLPLIGLLINLIFGRRFGEGMIGAVASLASGLAFVVSLLLAYSLSLQHGEAVRWKLAE